MLLGGKKPRLRALVSGVVLWTGLALIGVIAIPTGLLLGVIFLIWEAINFLLKKIDHA